MLAVPLFREPGREPDLGRIGGWPVRQRDRLAIAAGFHELDPAVQPAQRDWVAAGTSELSSIGNVRQRRRTLTGRPVSQVLRGIRIARHSLQREQ